MDKLIKTNWFGSPEINGNHIVTLSLVIVTVFILAILIYVAAKKQKPNKAPNAGIIIIESLMMSADNFANETHEGKFKKANPYFISIFVFFLIGNLFSLLGNIPVGSSFSVILGATLITWLVTFGLSFAYQKWKFLIKLINPLEIIGLIAPLISLTFRMFGNIIGGVVLITLFSFTLDSIWVKILGVSGVHVGDPAATINPLGMILIPWLNLYFDLFAGAIQAFVFMVLTISYWLQAADVDVKEQHKKKIKQWKKQMILNKNNNASNESIDLPETDNSQPQSVSV